MKKILFLTLLLSISVLNAQTEKITWDYPVKPEMEQWRQLKSMKEKYQACQIPDNILKQLDTETLVDICLRFPSKPLFPLFNTPQQAFMAYYNNFNGIRELFERKDAGLYLLKQYAKMSFSEFDPLWELHKQGKFISNYKFVESILSQPQVIASLDTSERKELLKEAINKMDEKLSKTDLFGGFSIEINMWVIGKVLYAENKLDLQRFNPQKIQIAMETGKFIDIDADMIYQIAKEYTY